MIWLGLIITWLVLAAVTAPVVAGFIHVGNPSDEANTSTLKLIRGAQ